MLRFASWLIAKGGGRNAAKECKCGGLFSAVVVH